MEPIVNRVAQSSLVNLDLEAFYDHNPRTVWDIKDQLYQGLILKEKDFREFLKTHHWSAYQGHNVAITCSVDAVIPSWAYMLLAVHLTPYVNHVVLGELEDLERSLFERALSQLDLETYRDARVVIKGCSKLPVPESAYVEVVRRLRGVAKSIMYGEPCSTVPLWKRGVAGD